MFVFPWIVVQVHMLSTNNHVHKGQSIPKSRTSLDGRMCQKATIKDEFDLVETKSRSVYEHINFGIKVRNLDKYVVEVFIIQIGIAAAPKLDNLIFEGRASRVQVQAYCHLVNGICTKRFHVQQDNTTESREGDHSQLQYRSLHGGSRSNILLVFCWGFNAWASSSLGFLCGRNVVGVVGNSNCWLVKWGSIVVEESSGCDALFRGELESCILKGHNLRAREFSTKHDKLHTRSWGLAFGIWKWNDPLVTEVLHKTLNVVWTKEELHKFLFLHCVKIPDFRVCRASDTLIVSDELCRVFLFCTRMHGPTRLARIVRNTRYMPLRLINLGFLNSDDSTKIEPRR
jgi:hypothetical protein